MLTVFFGTPKQILYRSFHSIAVVAVVVGLPICPRSCIRSGGTMQAYGGFRTSSAV